MLKLLPKIKNITDIKKIESTLLSSYIDYESTYEMLSEAANSYRDRLAIRFLLTGLPSEKPIDITYQQLFEKITQTANLFASLGVNNQTCVSYILPNLPQTHYTIWGGQAAGIVSAINPLLESDSMAKILNESQCKVLVTLASTDRTGIWNKIERIIDQVPTLETVLQIDIDNFSHQIENSNTPYYIEGCKKPITVYDFDVAIALQEKQQLTFSRETHKEDIAAYFHTGGTTGTPKLAQHSHLNEIANAYITGSTLSSERGEVLLCGLPLFHVNAVIVTGLGAFMGGSTVVLLTPNGYRNPNVIPNLWKIVEKYKVNAFVSVPTILTALLNVPIAEANIDTLKYAVSGAAPLSVGLFEDFEAYSNINILEGYGLTESTCTAAINPIGNAKIGSVGLRLPFQEVKTVIFDNSGNYVRDCHINEIGILALKGPNIFPGYKQKEKNKDIFFNNGWLNTGDLAKIDDDTYIHLMGREKDLIIRGGHNIDPGMVEDILIKHPDVELVAVVGQPDVYAGETPCAYVTLKNQVSPENLIAYIKERTHERAATPVYIEVLSSMPVTAVGKIFKPSLRVMAIQRVLSNALEDAKISADVMVDTSSSKGIVATICSTMSKEKIDTVLKGYTVNYIIQSRVPS